MTEKNLRNITEIKLEEAIDILKIWGRFDERKEKDYQLRIEESINPKYKIARLHHAPYMEGTDLIFSEDMGVILGNEILNRESYIKNYITIKYLEKQGFDLEDIIKKSYDPSNIAQFLRE